MGSKYWIKVYHELLDDPLTGKMGDRLCWRMMQCFLLAGELDEGGWLLGTEDIAWRFRMSAEECETDLIELQRFGILEMKEGRWFVVKFAERQAPMTSTERTKRARERNKKGGSRETWRTRLWRPLPEDGGIYLLEVGPESYVGASVNVRRRVQQHFSEMKVEGNRFSSAFDKFGPDSVSVSLLEGGLSSEELPEREQHWTDKLTPTINAASARRHHIWDDADKKGRDAASLKRPSGVPETSHRIDIEEDTEENRREVVVQDLDTKKLIREWERSGGPITAAIGEDLADMAQEAERHRQQLPNGASGSNINGAEWAVAAIVEARRSATGSFNTRYVYAILKRWMAEGYKSERDDKPEPVSVEDEAEWATERKRKAQQRVEKAESQK